MPAKNRTAAPLAGLATAIAVSLLVGPGMAEEMTMTRAIEAASLHEGPLDMVAYYVAGPDGGLEVKALFAPRDQYAAEPMRIVMVLGDGDDVAFAMPGFPQALYRFARAGEAVKVSVRQVHPAGL